MVDFNPLRAHFRPIVDDMELQITVKLIPMVKGRFFAMQAIVQGNP